MRQIFEKLKSVIWVTVLITLTFNSFAFQPKDGFKIGKIVLKDGHILIGEVLPLANFNQSNTLFKNEDGVQQSIDFEAIQKVVYGDLELIPKKFKINGINTSTYVHILEKGTATLYKAFFYGPQSQGKNNSVVAFQQNWLVSSPLNGIRNVGKTPSEKVLANALNHPAMALEASPKKLNSDAELIQWIQNYNSMLPSIPKEFN